MRRFWIALVLGLAVVGCSDPQPKDSYPSGAIPLGRWAARSSHSMGLCAEDKKERLYNLVTSQKGGAFNDDDECGCTFVVRGNPHGKSKGWCFLQLGKVWIEQPDGTYSGWRVVEE